MCILSTCKSNIVILNSLIDIYVKCGRIHKAQELFDKMYDANTVPWYVNIVGYTQNGFYEKGPIDTFIQ